MAASSQTTLRALQTAFMAPVIVGFVVGSLPVLLPVLAYRWLSRRFVGRVVATTAQTQ